MNYQSFLRIKITTIKFVSVSKIKCASKNQPTNFKQFIKVNSKCWNLELAKYNGTINIKTFKQNNSNFPVVEKQPTLYKSKATLIRCEVCVPKYISY